MIKQKFLLSLISLSLFIPTTTYADCTKEEIDNFKEIQDEYKVTYEFDKETKLYVLTLYIPNSSTYDFISDKEELFSKCETIKEKKVNCNNIEPGEYNFGIIGVTSSCNNVLKRIKVTLPKYNKYAEDKLCEGIEDFVLCQPTYDKSIDYDTFVSRIETYKKNHQGDNKNDEIIEEKKESPNKIIQYIQENIIQIIIIIIFIVMVIITIILTAKSIKKSRRLE